MLLFNRENKIKITYPTDFTIVVKGMYDMKGDPVDPLTTTFYFEFFDFNTKALIECGGEVNPEKLYVCSYTDDVRTNCVIVDNELHLVFENYPIDKGLIFYRQLEGFDSDYFEDTKQHITTCDSTNINVGRWGLNSGVNSKTDVDVVITRSGKGDKGDKGEKGDTGPKGDPGLTTHILLDGIVYEQSAGTIELPDYPTSLPASDVYDWAKQPNKPTYGPEEVNALPSDTFIPEYLSELEDDINVVYTDGSGEEVAVPLPTYIDRARQDWNGKTLANQEFVTEAIEAIDIPTKTSQLSNDSDYTTKTYVDGLMGNVLTALEAINGGAV